MKSFLANRQDEALQKKLLPLFIPVFKISMNVLIKMEVVIMCVRTMMEASPAAAMMDTASCRMTQAVHVRLLCQELDIAPS